MARRSIILEKATGKYVMAMQEACPPETFAQIVRLATMDALHPRAATREAGRRFIMQAVTALGIDHFTAEHSEGKSESVAELRERLEMLTKLRRALFELQQAKAELGVGARLIEAKPESELSMTEVEEFDLGES